MPSFKEYDKKRKKKRDANRRKNVGNRTSFEEFSKAMRTSAVVDAPIFDSNRKMTLPGSFVPTEDDSDYVPLNGVGANALRDIQQRNQGKEDFSLPLVSDVKPTTVNPAIDNLSINERRWFKRSIYADEWFDGGAQKAAFATWVKLSEKVAQGIIGVPEKMIDGAIMIAGKGMSNASDIYYTGEYLKSRISGENKETATANAVSLRDRLRETIEDSVSSFVMEDLYDEEEIAHKYITEDFESKTGLLAEWGLLDEAIDVDRGTITGEKTDDLAVSAGEMIPNVILGIFAPPAAAAVTATKVMGSTAEEELREGESFDTAFWVGAVNAAAETLTEYLFSGIKFGGKTVEDMALSPLIQGISNQIVRTAVRMGVDILGEGAEEVISELVSRVGEAIIKDEDVVEALTSDEALHAYSESFLGGAILGGGSSVSNTTSSTVQGKDPVTGLNKSEQAVVDKAVDEEVARREANGKKVSLRERGKLVQEILDKLESGDITTDDLKNFPGFDKNEQSVVDKLSEERIAEVTKDKAIEKAVREEIARREAAQGGTFSDETKKALRETIVAQIESGERDISSEELSKKEIAKIKKEIARSLEIGDVGLSKIEEILTPEETKQVNELEERLENTKDAKKRAEIQAEINRLKGAKAEKLRNLTKWNKHLAKAAYERVLSGQRYKYDGDINEITDENEKALIESAIRTAGNTTFAKRFVNALRKLAKDRNVRYILTNNQELWEQGDLKERDNISAKEQAKIDKLEKQLSEAKTKEEKAAILKQLLPLKYMDTGGLVRRNITNGVETVILNVDSTQSKYTVLGHETKHILEKYKLNKKFNEVLFNYAEKKGDLATTRSRMKDAYKNQEGVDIDSEVAAELTGRYLFEDNGFMETLMSQKSDSKVRQIINAIKELIDDLVVRFKGTEQEKDFRELQKRFLELYNSTDAEIVGATTQNSDIEKTVYSFNDNLENVGKILYDNNNPLSIVNRATTNNSSSINWVYKSEIFSVTENKLFHEKISEINQGSQAFEKNSRDEYMIPIGNKIVFTDGNYDSPYIREVVEVLTDNATEYEVVKETILGVENGKLEKSEEVQVLKALFGNGFVISYKSGVNGVYEWENGKPKGKTRRTVVRNYLNKHYRTGNDKQSKETQVNEIAPIKETSSTDGVFFDGKKKQYSLSDTNIESLEDIETKYKDKTDVLFLHEGRNDTLSISNMVVKKEYRNQGIGTQILNDVISYADENGKTITLTPTTEFGTQNKLKKWYKANGFVENKGRNADLRLSDTMYRLPEKKQYSLSDSNYLSAVKSGDLKVAQELVDEAAKSWGAYTENGKPVQFSHGTKGGEFTVFEKGDIGFHFGTREQAKTKAGYITPDKTANPFFLDDDGEVKSGRILDTYLKMDNPLTFSRDLGEWTVPRIVRYFEALLNNESTIEIEKYDRTTRDFSWEKVNPKEISDIRITEEDRTELEGMKMQYERDALSHVGEELRDYTYSSRSSELLRNFLISKGYDSIKYLNEYEGKENEYSYMVFFPNQIKSSEPITYDAKGNVIPLSKRFNENNNDIRYSLAERGEGVEYSKSLQSIRYNPMDDMFPTKAELQNTANVIPNGVPMTEDIGMSEDDERAYFESLTDADAPPEFDMPIYEMPDTSRIDESTLKSIGQSLRETLSLNTKETKTIQEVVQKYSTTEFPSREKLFAEIKEKFGEKTWTEQIEEIAEIKMILKGFKFKVSDTMKSDIPDYNDWRKRNFGKITIAKDGMAVDDVYMGMSHSYPNFFPSDIINPTDQLLQFAEVMDLDANTVESYELDDYTIQDATDIIISEVNKHKEALLLQGLREEQSHFYKGIAEEETAGRSTVKTVEERLAEKIRNARAELLMNQQSRDDSFDDFEKKITRLQAEYNAKQNKNTKVANNLLRRIEQLQRTKRDVDADYSKRISDIEARIEKMESQEYQTAEHRKSRQEEYRSFMERLIGDTSTWKDKSMGIFYEINTLRRNLRDIVRGADGKRDIRKADAIYDELQGKYNHNEAELNRESNRIKGEFAKLKINKVESAYIQMLGEFRYNPHTTLTEDVVKDFYNKHKNRIDTAKVDKAIAMARQTYDGLLVRVNNVLREQGMKEIPYRKGYFPHFNEEKQGFLGKLFNWKTKNDEIPTDIAGLTEMFEPNRSWQSFNKQRKGDTTDYNFLKGLDTYVQGSLDWIYHIEDIQKRRAFENHIRYIHSEQGVKERIDAIRNSDEYDADEMQEQIDLVYKESKNPLGNFVTDFRTQTNTLAGKKSSMDRGMEQKTNRKIYSIMTNVSNRVTANSVVGSVSSALTNFIPITQSWVQVNPGWSLLGMKRTIQSIIRDDGTINKSDFLTNRLGKADNLYRTNWDKTSHVLGLLMDGIDNFTSQTIWRSKYMQNLHNGMSEAEAIKNADQFAENVMAGRSRGNNPTIFDSKNPITKVFTAFQLEVNNQYGYMFKDAPQDIAYTDAKAKAGAKLVAGYTTAFIGAYVYNALFSALTGRDAAFDPIGIVEDLMQDLGFGDDDEEEKEIETTDVVMNLIENVLEEVPFVGGLLGGGRIPISSAMPYGGIMEAIDGTIQDISDENTESLTKEWLRPLWYLVLPMGGGQAKKTKEGLDMFDDDLPISGSYTDSGDLRFPVEDTPKNKIQAALFGQWSNENAQDYFENERQPLKDEQIEEYVELDLPIAEYWEIREGLRECDDVEEKFDYVADLDLPVWKKNILINNIVDRDEGVDMENYDDFDSYEEFDFATSDPEMYEFLQENGVSYEEYEDFDDDERSAYRWAFKNPDKYTMSQAVTDDVAEYRRYTKDINDIKADYDRYGNVISGSRKEKVIAYINTLDIDEGQARILFKSVYDADDTYNDYIVDYLNSRDDISREEMITILEELGATVDSRGNVWW